MYDVTITNGNIQRLIHNHRGYSNSQKLPSGEIVDAVNSISSFSFTVYPNNAGYEQLNPYTTLIRVRNTKRNRDDFVGRVLQVNPEMDSNGIMTKSVICEDRLGFLQDSIQPYSETRHYAGDDTRTGLEEFIDVILGNHNAQVEEYKRIYRGTVTVNPFKTSEDVTKGLNWETTFNTIKSKLLDSFGGFIILRETAGVLYLDYLESVGETRSTVIKAGRNMRSVSKEIDPSGIITRLVPLGAKLTAIDENGNEEQTEERLTVASVNDGLDYIESEEYAKVFGIKYGTVIFDDVTDANNLLSKGTAWIAENNGLSISHDVEALELSLLGLDIDDFVLYDRYPVENPAIGIDDTLQIIKKVTDIIEPHNGSFEMGDIHKRLSDMMVDQNATLDNVLGNISNIANDVKNQITTVYTFVDSSISSVLQDPDKIWASVENKVTETIGNSTAEFETFTQSVRNILQMEADGTTMIFQTVLEEITRVEGVEASHYAELLTYIRFGEDGIEIGKQGNAITMKLDNDSLEFYNNGTRVAYMSDNTLYITDGRFTRSVRIGNYGFIPETNGSVSFTYFGGED